MVPSAASMLAIKNVRPCPLPAHSRGELPCAPQARTWMDEKRRRRHFSTIDGGRTFFSPPPCGEGPGVGVLPAQPERVKIVIRIHDLSK